MLKNYLYRNNLFDAFFSLVTLFGNPIFYILVLVFLATHATLIFVHLLLALLLAELLCILIKLAYHKDRPVPQSREGLYNRIDANSFPSVHSARISLLIVMLSLYYNSWSLFSIGLVLAVGVGYSRVYLKRHYVIDVLGGFLLGTIIAITFLTFS
jgi:membrane-associated phospholipid phosphatase